jgi:hypothetical protein
LPSEITIEVDGPTPWKLFLEGKISATELANVLYRKPIEEAMLLEMSTIAVNIENDLDATTEGWSERPTFVGIPSKADNKIRVRISITGAGEKKWIWVNYGTQEHPIAVTEEGKKMPIRSYAPKTSVGTLSQNPGGGKYGAIRAMSVAVTHPGIKARRFDQVIVQKYSTGDESVAKQLGKAVRNLFSRKR